jgi:hypothetical protein
MVSSVKSRPNHYETLGLMPAASEEEIARAFANKMSLFRAHPMGEAAQIFAAYETLRNAIKRREYDRSIGLIAKPEPSHWTFGAAQPRWAPFIASATTNAVVQGAAAGPRPELHATTEPETEEAIDARVASIATSLRQLARPTAIEGSSRPAPEIPRQRSSEPLPQVGLEQLLEEIRTAPRSIEERAFDWKQPAFAVGGLLLGAGLIGALAGMSVTHNEEAAQAGPTVMMELPKAEPRPNTAAPAAATPVAVAEAEPDLRPHVARTQRTAPRQQPASWRQAVNNDATQDQAPETASDPLAPEPADAQPATARLPLPDKVVAQTIERIGFACGEVTSTAAVESAGQGVFRVTCSSGQTFNATPVHGRYRFRRSGGR